MKLTGTAEKVFLTLGKWRIVEKYSTDSDRQFLNIIKELMKILIGILVFHLLYVHP